MDPAEPAQDNPGETAAPRPKAPGRKGGRKPVPGAAPFDPAAEVKARKVPGGTAKPAGAEAAAPDIFKARDKLIAMLGIERGKSFHVPSLANPLRQSEILGVGVGFRFTQKTLTNELVIKVFVSDKLRESDISPELVIPKTVDGFRTDVEESTQARPHAAGAAYPAPVKCGVACGVDGANEIGTIGAVVQMQNGDICILSNNHILSYATADSSSSKPDLPGTAYKVSQPGPNTGTLIAILEDYVPYNTGGPNYADAAVARTAPDLSLVSAEHMTYKVDPAIKQAVPGMVVLKDGMMTGQSLGMVSEVGVQNVKFNYPNVGNIFFDEIIVIRGIGGAPFSLPGDSGSLIVTRDTFQPVGLLVGGPLGYNLTYANPINLVMTELNIARIVSPDDVQSP